MNEYLQYSRDCRTHSAAVTSDFPAVDPDPRAVGDDADIVPDAWRMEPELSLSSKRLSEEQS
jgi:hypothetical protein